jgi:hypothetical protein
MVTQAPTVPQHSSGVAPLPSGEPKSYLGCLAGSPINTGD